MVDSKSLISIICDLCDGYYKAIDEDGGRRIEYSEYRMGFAESTIDAISIVANTYANGDDVVPMR